jgi:mannosyltransferase OCH1-like enzyme
MNFPKVIYFCNKTLSKMEMQTSRWKHLNPGYAIELYDDDRCAKFLQEYYGKLYVDIFRFLKDGPIKADFWRVCVLYKFGGVYSDIDNVPLCPIRDFIEPNVHFVTCSSFLERYNFNPNFIIATRGNLILNACINWYVRKYNAKTPYDYWEWSIMRALTDVLRIQSYTKMGVYHINNRLKIQIIKECRGKNHKDDYNIYKNKRVFNNRCDAWNSATHSFR